MKKRFRKGLLLALLAAAAAVVTSGCVFRSVDELYALPALPREYSDLQVSIQQTIDGLGAEYAVISSGSNTSTVQLLDLDSDGQQETAAVFLRVTEAVEKPMRVCLYRRGNEGNYRSVYMLEGDGTSINSVAYEDLDGDGVKEMLVSWQMSTRVYILSAFQLGSEGAEELVSTTYNESYLAVNLDGEGGKELLVFQQSNAGETSNRAEYYRYQDGTMAMVSGALLSDNMLDVQSAQLSRMSDGSRGVYVTSTTASGVLTDILVLEESGLRNVTRDPDSGTSGSTTRTYTDVPASDINGDGVMEIPLPMQAAGLSPDSQSPYYIIYWRQFDRAGNAAVSCATYHSTSDGWYLMLPSQWIGNVTVSRNDALSSRGERAVVFYYLGREGSEPQPFLTIYRLTGSNRQTRAKLPDRFILRSDANNIYAATFHSGVEWDCDLEKDELIQRFNMITAAWSTQ